MTTRPKRTERVRSITCCRKDGQLDQRSERDIHPTEVNGKVVGGRWGGELVSRQCDAEGEAGGGRNEGVGQA